MVEGVLVKDGETVTAGQRLLILKRSGRLADEETFKNQFLPPAVDLCAAASFSQWNARMGNEDQKCLVSAPANMVVGLVRVDKGQVLSAGSPLIELISPHTGFKADLKVPVELIGNVKVGQQVNLFIRGAVRQSRLSTQGMITSVSLLPIEADLSRDAGHSFYKATASLSMQLGDRQQGELGLRPGMPLDADITIDKRPLFEMLTN